MAASMPRAGSAPALSVPKWQIALAVAAPVAIGLGVWYWRRSKTTPAKPPAADAETAAAAAAAAAAVEPVTSAATAAAPVNQTPAAAPVPKSSRDFKNEGNRRFKEGKYADAIRCYQQAIDAADADAADLSTFYQNRAAAYEQLKNYEAVITECSKALELNGRYTKALHRRAKAYEITKKLENSLEDITAVCILEQFQNQSSLQMADRVLKELGKEHAKEAMAKRKPVMPSRHFIQTFVASFCEDPVLGRARAAAAAAADDEAADEADAGAEKTGLAAALAALQRGLYEAVVPGCCDELSEPSAPAANRHQALLLRGTFYSLLGEYTKAVDDYTQLVDDATVDAKVRVNALVKRATLRMQLGAAEASLHDLAMAAELGPDNADVFHHRGQVYMLLDQTELAVADFERAVRCNGDFAIALVQKLYTDYRRAYAVRDPALMQQAMLGFERAIERFPQCSECYLLYAQVLSDQQEFQKADDYFGRAVERDPANATAFVHRGLLQLQWQGDVDKATRLISHAIQLDPKCEFAFETLGTIEVQRGNLSRAIELFDRAIPLSKTELEMAHLFSLRDAAQSQAKVAQRLGVGLPAA